MIYVFITYFLFTVVLYTANNLSYHAMLSRISSDPLDQVKVSSVRTVLTTVATGVVTVCTPIILTIFGGERLQSAWTKITLLYVLFALISMLICFFAIKEKKVEEEINVRKSGTQILREFKMLLKNKYFYLAILYLVLANIISSTLMSSGIYYTRDVLGDEFYYSLLAAFLICATIPGVLLTPKIVGSIGKRRSLAMSCLITIAGCLIGIVNPHSVVIAMISVVVRSFGTAISTAQLFTLAPDIIAYIARKQGTRVEGLVTAANSFGIKIGAGLASGILGWALEYSGYDPTLSIQTDAIMQTEIAIIFWLPLILSIASLFIALSWKIDEEE